MVEKLWGEGFTTPGGDDYIPQLVKPLGLNPAMSVLDLAAGLGGAGRKMAAQYGCWVTGMEPSPVLAKEGMERSVKAGMAKQATIVHYDPENFKHPKRFDCIFAKEAFCFVKNREGLHDGIELSLKPRGQLLFTDYVFDKEEPRSAAVKDWIAKEPVEPFPLTMQQTISSLQQRNLDIRINEDITDAHRTLILAAIQSLTEFLAKPEPGQRYQAGRGRGGRAVGEAGRRTPERVAGVPVLRAEAGRRFGGLSPINANLVLQPGSFEGVRASLPRLI